jgi:hypothetical protein
MTPTTFSGSYLRTIEVLTVSQHVLDDLRILDDLLHSETSISAPMAASLDAISRSVRAIQISAPLTGRTP